MPKRKERAVIRRRQQKKTKIMIAVGIVLLVLAVVLLQSGDSASQAAGPARIGQPLADFSLTDIDGKTVRLSDYAGKTVLINAWATWCPPCKAEMPDLHAYYQSHKDKGFVLLAVNAGESADQAAAFADQQRLTFPVLLDPDTRFLSSLGIRSFPTSVLVSPDGVVKAIHIGMFTPQSLEVEVTPFLRN